MSTVTVTFEGVQVEETTTRRVGCVRVVVSGLPDGLLAHLPAQALQGLLLNALASQSQSAHQVERTTVAAPEASAPVPAPAPIAPPVPAPAPAPAQSSSATHNEVLETLAAIVADAAGEENAQHAAAPEPVPAPATEVPAPTPVPPAAPELAPLVDIGGYKCRRCAECGVLFVPFSTLVHGGEGPGKTPAVLRCPRHQPLTHLEGFKLQRAGFEFGFRPVAIDGQEVLIIAPAKAEPVRPSAAASTIRPTTPAKQMPPVANLRPQSMWVRYTDDTSERPTYIKVRKCEHREKRLNAEGKPDGDKLCGDWFQVESRVDGDARCCPAHLPDVARQRIADNMMHHGCKYGRDYVKVTEGDGKEHSLYLYRFVRVEQEETAAYWAAEDARSKALRQMRQALAKLVSARESDLSFKEKRIAIFEANLRIAYIENGYKLPSSMPDFEGSLRLADPMSQQEVETAMARVVVRGILEGGIRLDTNFPGFYSPEHAANYAALQARKAGEAKREAARQQKQREAEIKAAAKTVATPARTKPAPLRGLIAIAQLEIAVAPAPATEPAAEQPTEASAPVTVQAEEGPVTPSEAQPTEQSTEEPARAETPAAEQVELLITQPPVPTMVEPAPVEVAQPEPVGSPLEVPVAMVEPAPAPEPGLESAVDPVPAETLAVEPGQETSPSSAPLTDLLVNGRDSTGALETVFVTATEEQ
jgi:hypothetical protein